MGRFGSSGGASNQCGWKKKAYLFIVKEKRPPSKSTEWHEFQFVLALDHWSW